MNTSALYGIRSSNIHELFPELHAEYKFRNSPNDLNYTRGSVSYLLYFNSTEGTNNFFANGFLVTYLEEFTQGRFNVTGDKYMNRMWTIKIPETTKIPYDPSYDNSTKIEILSVPIVVKAYTCKVMRVKDDDYGSYNLIGQNLGVTLSAITTIVERKWNVAVVNGRDSSIYELTPEHWASYFAVKDSQTAQVAEVPVQINLSCISVHTAYILIFFMYIIMIIIGCIFSLITLRKLKIPNGVIGWASHACKEADVNGINRNLFNYKFTDLDKEDIKIILKNEDVNVDVNEYVHEYEK